MRRIGRLASGFALFLALTGAAAHAQQPQTQMFAPPTLHGVLLDWCAHFGKDCGKPAADLFCREQHFDEATTFSIDQNAGQRGIPTLVFGDGSLCQGAQCSGFRQITCARTVAAQPQAPPAIVAPPPTIAAPPARQLTPAIVPQSQPRLPPVPPAVVQPLRPLSPPPPLPPQSQPPVIAQPPALSPTLPSEPPPAVAEPAPQVPLPHLRPAPPEIASPQPAVPPVAAREPVRPHIAALDPTAVAKLPMGEIHLVAPEVVPAYDVEIPNPIAGEIPTWDDETVFKWKPSNPNMADTYEIQFYNAFNTAQPVATAHVPGNQTYKRTSIQFLQDLLASAGVKPGANDDFWSLLWDAMGTKQGNILWEVAGYRNFSNSGVAQGTGGDDAAGGGSTEVQVAVSERWPLRAPDRANGYGACGANAASGIQTGSLYLFNKDANDAKRPQGVDYVYDLMQVKGAFSLANSPYASHPKEIMAPPQPGALINITVASYQFDNLFIDWGDGDVEPLTVDAVDQSQWDRKAPIALDNVPASHRYLNAGSYYVRIFQVSEQDLQKVDVSTLGIANKVAAAVAAQKAQGTEQTIDVGGYYGALLTQQGVGASIGGGAAGGPTSQQVGIGIGGGGNGGSVANAGFDPNKAALLQGGFPADVAARAYVVYCAHVTPTEPMDDVAFGDLNLYSADIVFDDSHAIDKANPIEGRVAACDDSAKARLNLKYIGKGTVTVTWKVDGVVVGGVTEHEIGPSPSRNAIELKAQAPPKQGTWLSDWQSLVVSEAMIGAGHKVTAEIKVKDKAPVKRLLLRPSKQGDPNAPPFISALVKVIQTLGPDGTLPVKALTAGPRTYTVVENAPGVPCHLRYMVMGGAFDVFVPDATKISSSGNTYSGSANLLVPFANQGQELTVPITFDGWQVENDSDVVAGALNVTDIADGTVNLPGLTVTLKALNGTAGTSDGKVDATIDVVGEGGGLRSSTGGAQPPKWTGETATLAPNGDWYRPEASTGMTKSVIGWSGFLIDADTVALDFSAKQGNGPGNVCGAAGADWIGARLDVAKVEPNLFHLDSVRLPVDDWIVGEGSGGAGLCGDLDASEPVPKRDLGEGSVAIHHITATVRGGFLKNAQYDMEVGVPILGVTIAGTGTLMQASGQEPKWDLSGLTGPAADLKLGTVRLQASNYQFGTDVTGWRVTADTKLTLTAEGKSFATVTANGVRYGLDGRIHFDDAAGATRTIGLSGNAALGQNPVILKSATLTGAGNGTTRLGIQVATSLHLSDALPSPDVTVGYAVVKSGDTVSATGPTSAGFEVKVAFPAADPGMTATIHPQYVGNANAGGAQSGIKFYAGPGNAAVDFFASNSPVQSAFVLGYSGSKDYWMTLSDYSLGPTGTPLIAPIINLFDVSGGLGYHVSTDKFVGLDDVRNIPPSTGTGLTFLAGITAGTPDHTTFTLDGQLKMTETDKVRFDFTSWLLKQKSGSTGDFTGFIQYGGGSFDGQIWGGLSILDGAVKVSADQGAVDMHFGSGGPWHIYLGNRNGPKIQASLLNLGGTDGYVMLDASGVFVGSGANINLGGSVGPFSATVKGWLAAELGVQPLVPRVSGSAKGGLSVKGCAFGLCVGPDASVTVKMAALPVDVSAEACFSVDLLLDTVGACGHVSL